MSADAGLRVVASDATALARADETRRHGVADGRGEVRFTGLTRPEAEDALPALAELADPAVGLVRVVLPVVLTDGAGPHMVDADGRLTLAIADHPGRPGWRVAVGEPLPHHRVGIVAPAGAGVWRWVTRASVEPTGLARAIDDLLEHTDVTDRDALGEDGTGAPSG